MRLKLHAGDEPAIHDNDKIPVFFRTEISRQGRCPEMYGRFRYSLTLNEPGKQSDEAVHLFAASDH